MPSQEFQDRKALTRLPTSGWENQASLGVGKPTIDRLEKRGLIERQLSMIGTPQCRITDAGRQHRNKPVVKPPKRKVALTMLKPSIKVVDPTPAPRSK